MAVELGRLEMQWRTLAADLAAVLPAEDDLRLSLLRTLRAFDEG
jgi:hypothetical protein